MQYKMQQVLRTKKVLRSVGGTQVPVNTRVVVMNQPDAKQVRVKVADPTQPDLAKQRVLAGVEAFDLTHRGRPKK